jgi:hypothetical protein
VCPFEYGPWYTWGRETVGKCIELAGAIDAGIDEGGADVVGLGPYGDCVYGEVGCDLGSGDRR